MKAKHWIGAIGLSLLIGLGLSQTHAAQALYVYILNGGSPVGPTNPLSVNVGQPGTAGDATIATGGTAQNLFSGTTPTNGYSVINPNLSDDCWVSDSTTAVVNGKGSQRVAANGGEYRTPTTYKPVGAVSAICPTTNDVLTARRW